MRFLPGDLVKLRYCDIKENQEIVGKPVKVIAQQIYTSPFWIDVVYQGNVYSCRGSDCTKLSTIVAGIDEVGRGAFAGPLVVVAAAFRIVGPWDPSIPCPVPGVKDSKKYPSHAKRVIAAKALLGCPDLITCGRGEVTPEEINGYGMGWAMKRAIHLALAGLKHGEVTPDLVLLDGNETAPSWDGKQMSTPKADDLWWPVSAASVLAKVYRDQHMERMDEEYPGYGFSGNRGYGTPEHIDALRKLGPCAIHRTKFIKNSLTPHEDQDPNQEVHG